MLKDFLTWLDANLDPKEGDEARLLKEVLADRSGALWQAADLGEARKIVEQYALGKQSPAVLQIFDAAVEEWQRTEPSPQPAPAPSPATPQPPEEAAPKPSPPTEPSPGPRTLVTLFSYFPVGAVFLIAFLLVGIIAWALADKELLRMLGEIAVARGLITFLFAVGTIGIAVLMVSALFVGSESGLKERFDHGNQILTALIAILGTVVGFYFGSPSLSSSTGTQNEQIEIGAPVLVPSPAYAGSDVQLHAFAWGGAVPFTYNIDLRSTDGQDEPLDSALADIKGGKSEDGVISEKIAIPPDAFGKKILIDLEVTDGEGHSARLVGHELNVQAAR